MKTVMSVLFIFLCINGYTQKGSNILGLEGDRVIIKGNSEIKGENFVYDEWNDGILVLNDSVFSNRIYLKYDAYKKRVFIKKMNKLGEIIEIMSSSLTGFSILESKSNLKHDFVMLKKSNFKGEEENGFYEIVFNLENTNYFIKKNHKILFDPNRSKGSKTFNNLPFEYRDKNSYYIKNDDNRYVKIRLNKKDIKAILIRNTKKLDLYNKSKKLSYRKEGDVMKMVNYYYSL